MMPHPERAVDELLGGAEGLKVFQSILKQWKHMSLMLEPNPTQIKEERIYAEMGLTDEEFAMVEKILGRLPNYTETGLFSVMWSEHCSYKNSKPVLRKFPTTGERVLQYLGKVLNCRYR